MKAKRRHELKENVLAKDLSLAGEFVRKYLNWLIGGVLVIIVVVALAVLLIGRQKTLREDEWRRFELLASGRAVETEKLPQAFADLAGSTSAKGLAAWSYVEAARQGYTVLMTRYPQLDDAARRRQGQQISDDARKAISQDPDNAKAAASAHMCLALLAETEGRLDAARQEYDQVVALRPKGAQNLADETTTRLEKMKAYAVPLVFPANGPKPWEPPAETAEPMLLPPGTTRPAPATGPAATTRPAASATQPR